jgi:bifunctional DNA-binding transcriptional regulator/antitoxin component of YhaV-PrlF toxin-antitoxin module
MRAARIPTLALIALVATVTGCGSDDDPKSTSTTATKASTTSTTADSANVNQTGRVVSGPRASKKFRDEIGVRPGDVVEVETTVRGAKAVTVTVPKESGESVRSIGDIKTRQDSATFSAVSGDVKLGKMYGLKPRTTVGNAVVRDEGDRWQVKINRKAIGEFRFVLRMTVRKA